MKKIGLVGAICLSIFLSACGEKSGVNEATEELQESETELQASDEEETEEKNDVLEEINYREIYAREDKIDSARELVIAIPDHLSAEELKDGAYIKATFEWSDIRIELYNDQDDLLASGYYNPDNQYARFWYNYSNGIYELYDENDRLYMKGNGFNTTIYKYDEQGQVTEEECIYNYFEPEYLAESIMDDIEPDEDDNVYIDNIVDAVYELDEKIYDYIEYDYERNCFEYDKNGNCIKELSYSGSQDDTLYLETNYTYEDGKLVQESDEDGSDYIDYEYDGENLKTKTRFWDNSLYSTTKYYYDPANKTQLMLEEYSNSELVNELTGIIYLNR